MLAVLSKTTPGSIHRRLSELGYSIWNSDQDQVIQVETAAELDMDFSVGKVGNILAIHQDRLGQVRDRLLSSGVELMMKSARSSEAKAFEQPVRAIKSKAKEAV
jgi:hypothetical protein